MQAVGSVHVYMVDKESKPERRRPFYVRTMEVHGGFAFLPAQVVGFDMVDDESKPERRPAKHMKSPREWDLKHNPAYAYYAFYTYANLYVLNKLREASGLNTFALRPHAGGLSSYPKP
jgi:adenosine deaminase